jgi:copper ion binding protein
MEKKVLNVTGMNCEHCVKAVTEALNSLSGLTDVTVNLKSGTASFSYDPSSVSLAAVKAAIADEGYEVIE